MPTPALRSRLPATGTTIFSTMSALVVRHGAVNLGQGFPDFDCDPQLVEAVSQAMRTGHNQYPLMAGVPALREAVAAKIAALYGRLHDPDTEITVTAGATQALFTAILASTQPGDEVIVLDPCYDSYEPAIRMAGAIPVRVPLAISHPADMAFVPDFAAIAAAISPRTRLMIINTPHNPGGSVWTDAQMRQLQALLAPTDILLISDEVYEHMVFDGDVHQSVSRYPQLAERAFVVSSFGKTFHVTGWKVGTVAAPAALMNEFRKVHQFNVFTVNTPAQHGLASWLSFLHDHPEHPGHYLNLPTFYQHKRDLFRSGLAGTGFRLLDCAGTYFQTVDVSALVADAGIRKRIRAFQENAGTDTADIIPETTFCEWLTAEIGVAAIPLSPFYGDGRNQNLIRFCFAKKDATLQSALQRLQKIP